MKGPPLGVFERYKFEGKREVYRFRAILQGGCQGYCYHGKKGDGCYVETWKKDGYTVVTTSNSDDVTIKFPDRKQVNLKRLEFVNGWAEFEMNGIKRRHKKVYLGNDEYIARSEFSKDGKAVKETEHYRRV